MLRDTRRASEAKRSNNTNTHEHASALRVWMASQPPARCCSAVSSCMAYATAASARAAAASVSCAASSYASCASCARHSAASASLDACWEARCHVSRRFARGMRGRGAPAWRLLRGAASWRRALAYCRRRTRRPGCPPARRARRRCAPPRRWWLLSPPRRRQPLREERVSQGRAVVRAQRRAPAASASPSARADTSSASITAASASRSACGCVQRERVRTGKAANERAANTAPAPQPLIS